MCGYSINFSEQDPCGCRPLLYHHSPLAHFPLKSYIHRTQDIITKMDFKLNKTIFLLTLYAEIILPSCCQQPFNSYWASSMNSTGTYSHLFHHNTHKSERRKDLSLVFESWMLTSAPSPNRAPSQNRVLALWNTAALDQIEKQCEKFMDEELKIVGFYIKKVETPLKL